MKCQDLLKLLWLKLCKQNVNVSGYVNIFPAVGIISDILGLTRWGRGNGGIERMFGGWRRRVREIHRWWFCHKFFPFCVKIPPLSVYNIIYSRKIISTFCPIVRVILIISLYDFYAPLSLYFSPSSLFYISIHFIHSIYL